MKLWNEIFVWTQQRVLNLKQYLSCFYCFVTYDVTLSGSPPQTSEILKRSFISTIPSPTVHTNPSRKRIFFENVLQTIVCLPLLTMFKPEVFENGGFRCRVDGIHFENRAFRKRWHHSNQYRVFLKYKSKMNRLLFRLLRRETFGAFLEWNPTCSNSSDVAWTVPIW